MGRFPLWNPLIACGTPFLAAAQNAALYPVNLLLAPFDPFRGLAIAAAAKLSLAAGFSFLYLRRLGAGRPAALLSALTFAFSGFMMVWLGHPHANAACLLPALAYCLRRLSEEGSGSGAWAGLAAAFGCMLLGGHPPTAVHLALWCAAYAAFLKTPRSAPAAFAAGALLAAPALLPFLEYYRLSSAGAASENLQRWAAHLSPASLTHLFAPFISGHFSLGFEQLRAVLLSPGADNFSERTGYVGALPLYLALLAAALRRREPEVRFHAAAAALSFAFIFGAPPLPQLVRWLPGLSSINHTRLWLVADFSLAVLAGLGLDHLPRLKRPAESVPAAVFLLLALGLVLFWLREVFRPHLPEMTPEELRFVLAQLPILYVSAAIGAAATLLGFGGRAWIGAALCLACSAADLLRFADRINPSIPRALYYPSAPSIDYLRADASVFRIGGIGWILPPNSASVYGLADVRGQDFLMLRRYEELLTGKAGDFNFYFADSEPPAALDALGLKYLLAPPRAAVPPGFSRAYSGEVAIFRNERGSERSRVVGGCRALPTPEILRRMRSGRYDMRREILLEEQPAQGCGDPAGAAGSARILDYSPDQVVVEARSERPAFLLLFDSYYPGWEADVDGKPEHVLRADYHFRAVRVPAGVSRVTFRFRPTSFYVGLALAALAAAVLAGAALSAGRGR